MPLEERKCPSCGGNHMQKTDEGLKCLHCGAILSNANETKTTNVHIYRDEAKIEKIRSRERKDIREAKSSNRFAIGFISFFALFFAVLFLWGPWIKAPVNSASDYKNRDKEFVVGALRDAGFWKVSVEPLNDLLPRERNQENLVANVTISGDDTWVAGIFKSKKEYNRFSPVKVYYHSMNPDAVIDAPEGNGTAYRGMDYLLVQNRLEDVGFSNIGLRPLHDLQSTEDEKTGMTDYVTISGEVEWSEGFLQSQRKRFRISEEVLIFYHSK